MRVWAKNQLKFELFEKTLKLRYRNLNGNLIFKPIFSHIFQVLSRLLTKLDSGTGLDWGLAAPGVGVVSRLGGRGGFSGGAV